MNFSTINLKTKIAIGYSAILVLLTGVAGFGLYGMADTNDKLKHITEVNVKKMALLEDMSNSVHVVSRVIRTLALVSDQTDYDREYQKIVAAREEYDKAFTELKAMPLDQKGQDFVAAIVQSRDTVRPKNNHFLELSKTDKEQSVVYLLKDANPPNAVWQAEIHDFIALQREKNKREEIAAAENYSNLRTIILLFTLGAILISIAFGLLIIRSLMRQLGGEPAYTVQIADKISSGDLSVDIDLRNAPSDSLLAHMKTMRDNFAGIVAQVAEGAETISTAAREISMGTLDLSKRSESQAGSIEETAASVEQLTSTVKQNADNSRQANQLASSASNIASSGGMMVGEVITTMNAITDSSKKIVDIISVIDGIAFQTNILALNAAVEAARAGEQGRGFAVVASEVRNLAQRSATAAKEIKTLISDTVEKVSAGAQMVDDTGHKIDEVVASVKRVSDVIGEISAASQEQSAGIDQIHLAITHLDDITQQNAALVEQASAAAQSLDDQAMGLKTLVGTFKLNGDLETPARRATKAVIKKAASLELANSISMRKLKLA